MEGIHRARMSSRSPKVASTDSDKPGDGANAGGNDSRASSDVNRRSPRWRYNIRQGLLDPHKRCRRLRAIRSDHKHSTLNIYLRHTENNKHESLDYRSYRYVPTSRAPFVERATLTSGFRLHRSTCCSGHVACWAYRIWSNPLKFLIHSLGKGRDRTPRIRSDY